MIRVLLGILLFACSPLFAAENGEARFLSQTRQLTLEGRRAGEGYFNPAGDKLIFQSEREPENPFYQIYILDLTTGDTHRVSPGVGKTTCSFFQPGTNKVLFASTHLDPKSKELQKAELEVRASGKERRYAWNYDNHFDIFEANQDGTELKQLTTAEGYDAEGSYSPDGKKIAFTSIRDAYPISKLSAEDKKRLEIDTAYFAEIYIMDADGSHQTRLTSTPGYDGGPFFSPDGKRIIWRRFDESGMKADIYTMKLDGSDVQRLTTFDSMSWAPYFHPSGDYVIFASNKLGFENFELYLVDAQGEKEPVRVTYTDGFDGLPVFSPDGSKLCWTSTRHGGGRESGQIYLAKWNDTEARKALAEAAARNAAGAAAVEIAKSTPASSQTNVAQAEKELRATVDYLASDKLEGRLTGTEGEKLAADFIIDRMKKVGLQPFGTDSKFTSPFTFTAGVHAGEGNLLELLSVEGNPHVPAAERLKAAKAGAPLALNKEFLPISLSADGKAEGLLAFGGYGLVVPGENGKRVYDSYEKLDVKGRIVLVLRYVPEKISAETRQVYNRFAGLRYKAMQARERGALGILVVSGPNSPGAGELVPMGLDGGGVSSDIFAASISVATADRLLVPSKKTIKELQDSLDSGEQKTSFPIEDMAARMTVDLKKETRTGNNVIGVLPPSGGIKPDTEFIAIGAHYDHLGRGGGGNSLAHKGEEHDIHHGADDNASGVAALLDIAEAMAAKPAPRDRGVIFVAWSGEELGLLGSANFCKSPPVDLSRITAYLNMDMVGRVRDNKLMVQGIGSSNDWKGLIESKNVVAGFSLVLNADPYLPTDSMSFYLKQIPGLQFFSGAHEDYHRPTDTADKINYPDMKRTADFVRVVAEELTHKARRPLYAKVDQTPTEQGSRDSLRAYLGTIPDYAEEIKGVKLSGVREGGPADKAGLKGGDVIIQFGGQKISNIYDYTYALDAVKIGEPLKVVVQRGGKDVTFTVTPEARK